MHKLRLYLVPVLMALGLGFAPARPAYASWSAPSATSVAYSTAKMPTPGAATGTPTTTTTTSTYGAAYGCYNGTAPFWDGNLDAYVCNGGANYYYPGYYCPNGGGLSGTTCTLSTTTDALKFSWTTATSIDALGKQLAPQVQVVEASSCTPSSWTVVASVSD
ncbi:MAG: hypothetical protein ACYCU8_13530, partial [Ferrimicrobium acidiphilum]